MPIECIIHSPQRLIISRVIGPARQLREIVPAQDIGARLLRQDADKRPAYAPPLIDAAAFRLPQRIGTRQNNQKYRGGLGLRRDYLFPDHEASFTILADRERWGPHGLFGGLPGERAHYVLNPEGEARELGSKVTVQLDEDDVVSYRTCGGGGYGPPEERDPEDVLRDVRDGRVSWERARDVYRVVVDVEGRSVDWAETTRLRGGDSGERRS